MGVAYSYCSQDVKSGATHILVMGDSFLTFTVKLYIARHSRLYVHYIYCHTNHFITFSLLKICRVELYTELFYSIIPSLFLCFVLCHFFSSRCMLELKFAIYHRAASLSSQASSEMYAVLAEESLTRLCSNAESVMVPKTLLVFMHTTLFLIQQS